MKLNYFLLLLVLGTIFISGCQEEQSSCLTCRSTWISDGNNLYIKKQTFPNQTYTENDGTLVFNSSATVWDDTTTSIATAKLPITNPVVWKTWKGNLGSYAFEEKISTLEESVNFDMQLSHRVKLGSILACHLHYNVPTATTQNITFQLEYNCANISKTYYTTNKNITKTFILQNIAYRQSIADFGNIQCKGSISQIEKFYLKRLSSKDSYTNDVFVDYFDCHFEIDTAGSRSEYIK